MVPCPRSTWLPAANQSIMLAKLASYTLVGIDTTPVEVKVVVSFASKPNR